MASNNKTKGKNSKTRRERLGSKAGLIPIYSKRTDVKRNPATHPNAAERPCKAPRFEVRSYDTRRNAYLVTLHKSEQARDNAIANRQRSRFHTRISWKEIGGEEAPKARLGKRSKEVEMAAEVGLV